MSNLISEWTDYSTIDIIFTNEIRRLNNSSSNVFKDEIIFSLCILSKYIKILILLNHSIQTNSTGNRII